MKFDIGEFYENLSAHLQLWLIFGGVGVYSALSI
jgi:hypothetical protein